MQDKMKTFLKNISDSWNNLEKPQKTKLILTVIVVIVTIVLSLYLIMKPNMVVLSKDLDYSTSVQIQSELESAGIESKVSNDGTTIFVDEKDIVESKMYLSQSTAMSNVEFTFEDATNMSGMGTTETQKKANYQKAKESQLSSDLTMFNGVDSAKVNLVIPDSTNYFVPPETQASASVLLNVNEEFDPEEAEAIAKYLSASVTGLTMDNIEIVDQNGTSLYSGIQLSSDSTSKTSELEAAKAAEINADIQSALLPLYDDVRVVDNLVFNWDASEINDIKYTPPVEGSELGGISTQLIDKSSVENGVAGAEPGVGANDQSTGSMQMGTNGTTSTADTSTNQTDYLWNETLTTTTVQASGLDTEASSISVYVYEDVIYNEAVVMADPDQTLTWEQFKEQTKPVPIDVDPNIIASLQTGTGIQNLTVVGYQVPIFYDEVIEPVQWAQILMFAILAILIFLLAYGLIRNSAEEEELMAIEPELSVEELLVSSEVEETEEERKLKELTVSGDSEVKRQISKFVEEKPESAAQLLRNWLNDEWE